MSEFKLIEAVIKESVSKDWKEAKLEWYSDEDEWFEHQQDCICGHANIIQVCTIHNKLNGKELEVGNCCVKKFMDDTGSTKGFNALKKIKKDVRGRVRKDILLSSLVKSNIAKEDDVIKYDNSFNGKDTLESDYQYIEEINRKFLERHIKGYDANNYISNIKGIIPKEITKYRDMLKRKISMLILDNNLMLTMQDISVLKSKKLIGDWEVSFYENVLNYSRHSEKQIAIIKKISNIYIREFKDKTLTEDECSIMLTGITEAQRKMKKAEEIRIKTLQEIEYLTKEKDDATKRILSIEKKILNLESLIKLKEN